ncbi:MAG: hypothetical protein DRN20_00005 [Thermoplasmata archaeon]|nr:MAG: hypothetical protein DRN20_00005 [Thermoplasmata archaeon]
MTWSKKSLSHDYDERHIPLTDKTWEKMRAGAVCLRDCEEIGEHSTEDGEEVLVILSGKGSAFVDGEEIEISGGDVLHFGKHTVHNIVAKEGHILRYIYIYAGSKKR